MLGIEALARFAVRCLDCSALDCLCTAIAAVVITATVVIFIVAVAVALVLIGSTYAVAGLTSRLRRYGSLGHALKADKIPIRVAAGALVGTVFRTLKACRTLSAFTTMV